MPPTAWASGFSWHADRVPERRQGVCLSSWPTVQWCRTERSESLRQGAHPSRGLLGWEGSGKQRVVGGIPNRGDVAARWPREVRHVTIASSAAGHGVTPAGDRVWAR
jgi:hypothetical protein